jgi:hypothetical protein
MSDIVGPVSETAARVVQSSKAYYYSLGELVSLSPSVLTVDRTHRRHS